MHKIPTLSEQIFFWHQLVSNENAVAHKSGYIQAHFCEAMAIF
jgi:hypothetical protein